MGIIRYNYNNIVNIDSLDVHPPLYYLLLKIFLQVFTFWTKSVFVKTIVARLFSLLSFSLALLFLNKILILLKIQVNYKLQLLFYLFIPSIMSYSTTIRMYELAALFIIIEFYFIIAFNKFNNNKYLMYATIFALLSAYTHYFSAMSAGLFLFIFFVRYLLNKQWIKSSKYFISGLLFAIFYVPIIPFVNKQIGYETKSSANWYDNIHELLSSFVGVSNSVGLGRLIFVGLILILFISLIYWSSKNVSHLFNLYLNIILYNFGLTVFIAFISAFVNGTPFKSRYMFSDFSILSFFIVNIFIIYWFNVSKMHLSSYIVALLSCLFIFNSVKSTIKNIKQFDIPSITLIKDINYCRTKKSNVVNITKRRYPTQFGKPLYVSQASIYLRVINKEPLIKSSPKIYNGYNLFGHKNKRLYKYLFNVKTYK